MHAETGKRLIDTVWLAVPQQRKEVTADKFDRSIPKFPWQVVTVRHGRPQHGLEKEKMEKRVFDKF